MTTLKNTKMKQTNARRHETALALWRRRYAERAGFYVRRVYHDSAAGRLITYYVTRVACDFRPPDAGFGSEREAWEEAFARAVARQLGEAPQ